MTEINACLFKPDATEVEWIKLKADNVHAQLEKLIDTIELGVYAIGANLAFYYKRRGLVHADVLDAPLNDCVYVNAAKLEFCGPVILVALNTDGGGFTCVTRAQLDDLDYLVRQDLLDRECYAADAYNASLNEGEDE